jgi:hypothetical protein
MMEIKINFTTKEITILTSCYINDLLEHLNKMFGDDLKNWKIKNQVEIKELHLPNINIPNVHIPINKPPGNIQF